MITWPRIALIALAIGCGVTAALLPVTAPALGPLGGILLGLLGPQIGAAKDK